MNISSVQPNKFELPVFVPNEEGMHCKKKKCCEKYLKKGKHCKKCPLV